MKRLEDFMNRLTDMDWSWWPFLRLRPPQNVEIDDFLLMRLTIFGGCILGFGLFYPVALIVDLPPDLFTLLFGVSFGCICFFFIYKYSFAYFWNRRARRLQQEARNNQPK